MFHGLDVAAALPVSVYVGLFLVGAMAGFVDAIAGGGGLLTVPSLLLAGLPSHLALGTNKAQSVFGSSMALATYARSPLLDRKRAKQSFGIALLGAAAGVMAVARVHPDALRPLIMVLLAGVAVWMIFQRPPHVDPQPRHQPFVVAAAVAFVIAFYDGFFGPGTGTFLILAYAYLWRDSLQAASANAKVVNFASNLASVVVFACKGLVIWRLALPMAIGQAIGGYAGAHLTIKVGRSLVRYMVVAVSAGLLIKLAWDLVMAQRGTH